MFPFHCISVKIFRLEISQNQRDSVANFGNYYRSQLLKCQLTFSLPNANSKIMQNQLGTIELATLIKGILKIGNCCCPTITEWKTRKPPSHFMKPQIGIQKWYYPVRKHLWAARLTKDCAVFWLISHGVSPSGQDLWEKHLNCHCTCSQQNAVDESVGFEIEKTWWVVSIPLLKVIESHMQI